MRKATGGEHAHVEEAPPKGVPRISRRDALVDCVFLVLITLMSFAPFAGRLGFYADDWALLATLVAAQDRSIVGYFGALESQEALRLSPRPLESLLWIAQYNAFGADPLGYHLVRIALFSAAIALLYLVLRELRQLRLIALAVTVVYALLPNATTVRFWAATSMITLSLALLLLGLFGTLRAAAALPGGRPPFYGWVCLACLSIVGSGLAYEIPVPLALLTPALVWQRGYRGDDQSRPWHHHGGRIAALLGGIFLALGVVVAYKLRTTNRGGIPTAYADHLIRLATGAVRVNYGTFGVGLPYTAWSLAGAYPDGATLAFSAALALGIFGYLSWVARRSAISWPRPTRWVGLILAGGAVFALGYAVFLVTDQGQLFTTAGLTNRVAIAATGGVAISLIGGLSWLVAWFPTRFRERLFAVLVALVCLSGLLIVNTLAAMWVTAYERADAVLVDLHGRFPDLPSDTTLILDGVCRYVGPAVVFESDFDLGGALTMTYRDPTIRGAVVSPRLEIGEAGLAMVWYGERVHHPYGEQLVVYDAATGVIQRLPDVATAQRYFALIRPDRGRSCPPGEEGYGTPVLPPVLSPYEPRAHPPPP